MAEVEESSSCGPLHSLQYKGETFSDSEVGIPVQLMLSASPLSCIAYHPACGCPVI